MSDDEYARVLANVPAMIWRCDATGARDYFNESWLRFRGRTLEQERGQGWLEGLHPEDAGSLENLRRRLEAREGFAVEYRLRRYDGEYLCVQDTAAPVHDAAGMFRGFVGSCAEKRIAVWPLCSWCRRVRGDDGSWLQIEDYLAEHCSITFTHGICPRCMAEQGFEGAAV